MLSCIAFKGPAGVEMFELYDVQFLGSSRDFMRFFGLTLILFASM